MTNKINKFAGVCLLAALAATLSGCVSVKARPPESVHLGGTELYSAAPPSQIPSADPSDMQDLQRENRQLRERIAWLEEQNRKSSRKYEKLGDEMDEIRHEMDRIAAERDRYKRALAD